MKIYTNNGELIYKDRAKTVKKTVQNAIEKGISLFYADLQGVNLSSANLSGANLSGANLRITNLSNSNLACANLTGANLCSADLCSADLRGANLTGANLCWANLTGADLTGANLCGADLRLAGLSDVKFDESEQIRMGLMLTEPMKGYKKCCYGVIVELEIPTGAIVFSINNDKCRTNVAKTVAISNGDVAYSQHDRAFAYRVGEVVKPDTFDMRYNVECGSGIHFFRTRAEAEQY